MNIEQSIEILDDNFTVLNSHGHYTENEEAQAQMVAIRSLEVLQEVKKIIDIDNAYIQEDVIKYKMIRELVEKALREVEE